MNIKKEKRGEQICLLKKDKLNKLVFNNEALEVLKQIKGNFGTCVCVGPYRQGKSYLLSQLIGNTNNGFKIGHTDESCTKGIWMWSQPISINTQHGPANLLLFDTEGLESDESNQEWDTNLFLVSLIMSSMFLYNTKNALTSEAFKKLAAVTSFSQNVRFESLKNSSNEKLKDNFCPTFTWIIRDFSLISLVTPLEKLEKFLKPEEFFENPSTNFSQNEKKKQELTSRNQIRTNMKSAFKTLDCFYFPVPVSDGTNNMNYEEALANLHTLPINVLREPFQKALNGFKKHIEKTFEFKKINNTEMSGPIYVEFLKQVVANINNNEQICLMDVLDASHKIVATEILIKAKEQYEILMEDLISNNTMPLIWDDFDEEEDAIFIQCEDLIKSSHLNDTILKQTLTNFKNFIRNSEDVKRKGTLIYYTEINRNEIEKKNEKTFKMLWNNKFNEKLNNPIQYYATKLELQKEIDQLKCDIEVQMAQCDDFNHIWQSNLTKLKVEAILNDIDVAHKKKLEDVEKKRKDEEAKAKMEEETRILRIRREQEQEKENAYIRATPPVYNERPLQRTLYLRVDGKPDERFTENRTHLVNSQGDRIKKDGTPDMRFKNNKAKYGHVQEF